MKNVYSVRDKLTLFLLAAGVLCFGLVLPDSLSDHVKFVHFAAHFGMSFLLALSFYMICTVKMRISKTFCYTLLVITTLLIGVVYKYWEIASQGSFERNSFSVAIQQAGVLTSMSQNISGLLAAMLLIEGLVDRNLIMSVLRTGKLHIGPSGFHMGNMNKFHIGNRKGKVNIGSMPVGSQFSPGKSEN
jgi:hypothetical protein